MLPQNIQLKLVGPPIVVARAAACTLFKASAGKRAFALPIGVVRGGTWIYGTFHVDKLLILKRLCRVENAKRF
jgi:hypothetical protein